MIIVAEKRDLRENWGNWDFLINIKPARNASYLVNGDS